MSNTGTAIVSKGHGLPGDLYKFPLWRPPVLPSEMTTLASSGTYCGREINPLYALIWPVVPNTGGMWVLYFEPSPPENWLSYEAKSTPTVHPVPVGQSPWSVHIVSLRKDLGLPVGVLVEALRISRQTYYDWLGGEVPNLNNQKRIADVAAIGTAWAALGLGEMRRYWQLPAPSAGANLRQFLTGADLSIEGFQSIVGRLGLSRRLLPARVSKPWPIPGKPPRRHGNRKAWHVERDDKD